MFLTVLKIINWFLTRQSDSPNVVEEKRTPEKNIMKATIEPVLQIRDWSIDRIHFLADSGGVEEQLNALAISEEFDEWINAGDEINYMCLEQEDDFGDQEVDVI